MENKNYSVFLAAVILAIIFVSGCTQQGGQTSTTLSPDSGASEPTATGEIKEFEMTARQFEFEPSVIRVSEGDTVKINITSVDVTHGFAIDEFGINERLEPGNTVNVEFVADKKGTFTFYCSVFCGSGHGKMKGQLIVE